MRKSAVPTPGRRFFEPGIQKPAAGVYPVKRTGPSVRPPPPDLFYFPPLERGSWFDKKFTLLSWNHHAFMIAKTADFLYNIETK